MTQSTPTAALIDGIKFGTDGWRGVIAAEFTFERVCYVAAIAAPVLRHRVITTFNAEAAGITSDDVIQRLIKVLAPKEDFVL